MNHLPAWANSLKTAFNPTTPIDITQPGPLLLLANQSPQPLRLLSITVLANLEMGGLLIDGLTRLRGLILLSSLGLFIADSFIRTHVSLSMVIAQACILFLLRQGFLMASFGPTGIATQLKTMLGEDKGARAYEGMTALFFCVRSYSFSLLVQQTAFLNAPSLLSYKPLLIGLGCTMIGLGLVVNTWAFMAIGRGAYYYLDMFYGRFLQAFSDGGIYRFLANPMYSLGQLPAYGLAVLYGSWVGLVFAMANQLCCYLFYYWAEKPHIQRLL